MGAIRIHNANHAIITAKYNQLSAHHVDGFDLALFHLARRNHPVPTLDDPVETSKRFTALQSVLAFSRAVSICTKADMLTPVNKRPTFFNGAVTHCFRAFSVPVARFFQVRHNHLK